MGLRVLQQLNYLDLIIIIVLIRICYIAIKTGLAVELFKLMGVVSSIYIASHYYTSLSDSVQHRFINSGTPLEFVDFIIFTLLVILVYASFSVLRFTFYRFMKMEAAPNLNKYGGLILGLARGYFTIGLMVFMLMISSIDYFNDSVKNSYIGSRFSSVSAQTYNWLWDGIFSKFSSQDKPNKVVREAGNSLMKK